jgi:RimJ/RimL family protein N-acetyltransferase
MIKADLAIGAGGATTWERMCLGLPSIVISIAENQAPVCEALAFAGSIRYLGAARHLEASAIEAAIIKTLADPDQFRALGSRNRIFVDGKGVSRVIEALDTTVAQNLKLRSATSKDASIYFAWVNDPAVRSSAIHTHPVKLRTHLEWFDSQLRDVNSHLFVLEAGHLPVGQIRFEQHGDVATIDYSLDLSVRGRGWAKQLVALGISALNTSWPTMLKATVKQENVASAATFIRLGFVEQPIEGELGVRHFLLHSSQIEMTGFGQVAVDQE